MRKLRLSKEELPSPRSWGRKLRSLDLQSGLFGSKACELRESAVKHMYGKRSFIPQINPNDCHLGGSRNQGLDGSCFRFSELQIHSGHMKYCAQRHERGTKKTREGSANFFLNRILEDVTFASSSGMYLESRFGYAPVSRTFTTFPDFSLLVTEPPPPPTQPPACSVPGICYCLTHLEF